MNQEPDAGILDADTEEWQPHEYDNDQPSTSESREPAQPDGDGEPAWPDSAGSGGATAAERVQPRHARRRDLPGLATILLGVALVVASGLALYLWLQLGSARDEGAGDLSGQLAQANARLAETQDTLREAQVRVVDAETKVQELQEQLDATAAASADADADLADADDDLAEATEQLRAASDSLAEAEGLSEALASAVLGTVDPVDACVRAAAQVAENVDEIGRGQLAAQARKAAATCAAAQDSLGPAVTRARGVLAD